MRLIQELYAQAVINESKKAELEAEIKKSGKTEEEIILENKIVPEDVLFELKSKILKIPLKKISVEEVPLEVLNLISEEAVINYKMTPLFRAGNSVGIGMIYPEDISAQNALRFLARQENFTPEIYLITFTDLNNLLKQHRTLKSETEKALEQYGREKGEDLSKEKSEILMALEKTMPQKMIEEAPIIKMVLVILKHAIEGNASDIHIEPSRERLNVRFRQDGVLHLSLFLPLSVHASVVTRIKILANLKIDESRVPQDGRFSAKINNKRIDFRIATFPTLYGEKVEIRILDPKEGLKSFDELGLRGKNLETVKNAIQKPYGLIFSTGPTGSGKTTTLYAVLQILNQEGVNIVTLEDPIEYSIDGVNQSQIKPEIGYTFAEGLRQILRQDPNVIMVGEVRDEETASLTVHSALTGHIVLSTLHTNSSAGVVPRLIDMGIRPFLIPSVLRVAISQRLIRTLCPACRQKIRPSDKIKKYILENLKNVPASMKKEFNADYIWKAQGCENCGFKGYKGRIGLFEVLEMTDELADVILEKPIEAVILRQAQKQGMLTMAQEGIIKALSGETTIDEIERVTEET